MEKEGIPDPPMLSRAMSSSSLSTMKCKKAALPMHTISFVPPIVLVNLLPQDLEWQIGSIVKGRVRSGKETSIHEVCIVVFVFIKSLAPPPSDMLLFRGKLKTKFIFFSVT